MNELNTTSKTQTSSFTEAHLSRKTSGSEKSAIIIPTQKGKVYISNHAIPDLLRLVRASL
ncbi:hypothetical protein [Lactobacillus intestinalis]|uniref:hypothetical protein n=1 Tax=Lactobacillus intestinalis TaxID=151781 RepID=UPI0025B44F77|nr:hypothetical protein [Lactobacillus intestinalis]